MTITITNDVEAATTAATEAFAAYRKTTPQQRGAFLDAIAEEIEADKDAIIEAAVAESHLPVGRITGEVGRTTGQLRMFADVVRRGDHLGVRIDPGMPDREPLPRADIRHRMIPLGPVAVFGASNFPLAFSTAGGDTASALAAGCPVVVKGHPAHPRTGRLVADAISRSVDKSGLPEGTFTFLLEESGGFELGQALVRDPRIKAVGFTGSRAGGLAIADAASKRPEPIPVYAEMSSINPVVVLPSSLKEHDTDTFAQAYVGSLTLGSGQFCTNPGLLFLPTGPEGDAFVQATAEAVTGTTGQTMLTPGIADAFAEGTGKLKEEAGVAQIGEGTAVGEHAPAPIVSESKTLDGVTDEVFGASGVIVRYDDIDALARSLEGLEGQLTATVHYAPADKEAAQQLLPVLELKAGRVLFNGWPTGVEVGHAMVHGGPLPATSDSRSTSVGSLA
ncbi:MAG: aldehyde dehydrogenase (NADP(+)), partial [Nocardioides sp.]|uniref:aldehyde dehydrogenase (NADP(+)) n=1 Tax=Nocardioides sp. TaxID=35761 RepID=UPI003266C9CF